MRHSYAVSDNPAYVDRERPLTERGVSLLKKTAPLLAEWSIQAVYASSAVRTQQTAEFLLTSLTHVSDINAHEELYLASPEQYVNCLKQVPVGVDTVLIVGHNPTVAGLIATWSGEHFSVTPGSIGVFKFEIEDWMSLRVHNSKQPELKAYISQGLRMR